LRSAVALNARLRGGMASERRLGAGNGQGADGPEADREHAVEDLRAACARAGLPARLTNDARNVRRPPTTGYATVRSPWAISTAIGTSSLPPIQIGNHWPAILGDPQT